jgi:hypothetical protein
LLVVIDFGKTFTGEKLSERWFAVVTQQRGLLSKDFWTKYPNIYHVVAVKLHSNMRN